MEIKIKGITIKLENLDNLDSAVISIDKDSNIPSEEKGVANIQLAAVDLSSMEKVSFDIENQPTLIVDADNPLISSVKVTCNLKEDIYKRLKTYSKDCSSLNDEYLFNQIFDEYLGLRGY